MNRSNFFKSLGLALLSTSLLSFKNKSVEKDCLDFDLSHYKFSDDQLNLIEVTLLRRDSYYDNIFQLPEGKLYYSRTVNTEGMVVNEFWSLTTKDFKQYHRISNIHKTVCKKFDDFNTGISREIIVPMK